MSSSVAVPPTHSEALALHQRLLAHDPTAASDVADAYLEVLVVWLSHTDANVPEDIRIEAAEDAILAFIRSPESYVPDRQTLEVYLRMSARGDLRNLLRKERRHNKGRSPWKSVELSPEAGKYVGQTDDPAFPLLLAEEEQKLAAIIPDSVARELSEVDRRAVQLILQRERRTSVFAELYGLLHLSAREQRREVKRHKDRLKQVRKRAGNKP